MKLVKYEHSDSYPNIKTLQNGANAAVNLGAALLGASTKHVVLLNIPLRGYAIYTAWNESDYLRVALQVTALSSIVLFSSPWVAVLIDAGSEGMNFYSHRNIEKDSNFTECLQEIDFDDVSKALKHLGLSQEDNSAKAIQEKTDKIIALCERKREKATTFLKGQLSIMIKNAENACNFLLIQLEDRGVCSGAKRFAK